jgi:hypothetical protein
MFSFSSSRGVVGVDRLLYTPSAFIFGYAAYLYSQLASLPLGFALFLASVAGCGVALGLMLPLQKAVERGVEENLGGAPCLSRERVARLKQIVFELERSGYSLELADEAKVVIEGIPFKLRRLSEEGDRGELRFKPISVTESVE